MRQRHGACRAQIQSSFADFQRNDFCPHVQQFLAQFRDQRRLDVIQGPGVFRHGGEMVKRLAAQHEQDFLCAGQEHVNVGQRCPENGVPVSAACRTVGIRHRKIE